MYSSLPIEGLPGLTIRTMYYRKQHKLLQRLPQVFVAFGSKWPVSSSTIKDVSTHDLQEAGATIALVVLLAWHTIGLEVGAPLRDTPLGVGWCAELSCRTPLSGGRSWTRTADRGRFSRCWRWTCWRGRTRLCRRWARTYRTGRGRHSCSGCCSWKDVPLLVQCCDIRPTTSHSDNLLQSTADSVHKLEPVRSAVTGLW